MDSTTLASASIYVLTQTYKDLGGATVSFGMTYAMPSAPSLCPATQAASLATQYATAPTTSSISCSFGYAMSSAASALGVGSATMVGSSSGFVACYATSGLMYVGPNLPMMPYRLYGGASFNATSYSFAFTPSLNSHPGSQQFFGANTTLCTTSGCNTPTSDACLTPATPVTSLMCPTASAPTFSSASTPSIASC